MDSASAGNSQPTENKNTTPVGSAPASFPPPPPSPSVPSPLPSSDSPPVNQQSIPKPPPPLPWDEPVQSVHIPPTLPAQVASVHSDTTAQIAVTGDTVQNTVGLNPVAVATASGKKGLLHSKAFLALVGIILLLGGFAGSFFIAFRSNIAQNDLADVSNLQPTIAPKNNAPSITPKPTVDPSGLFVSPTIAFTNPFISPTIAFANPFGDYENPFASDGESQAYINPFSSFVRGAF